MVLYYILSLPSCFLRINILQNLFCDFSAYLQSYTVNSSTDDFICTESLFFKFVSLFSIIIFLILYLEKLKPCSTPDLLPVKKHILCLFVCIEFFCNIKG